MPWKKTNKTFIDWLLPFKAPFSWTPDQEPSLYQGRDAAQLLQHRVLLMQVWFASVARESFCSQELQCFYSPYVQSYAIFVCCLKIKIKNPSTGRHTTVWKHKNKAYTRSTLQDGLWFPNWHGNWKRWHMHFVSQETHVHTAAPN